MLKQAFHLASATLVKLAAGLIVVKFLAWQLGPEAFGRLGQLMAVVAVFAMFAGAGTGNGLIKLLSESRGKPESHSRWIAVAFTLGVASSALIALILIVSAKTLSSRLLEGFDPWVLVCLALVQALMGAGNLILAEFSSRGDSVAYALASVAGSVVGTALLVIAVTMLGFDGAAYGVVIMPAMTGVTALALVIRRRPEWLRHCRIVLDGSGMRRLLGYSAVTLAGAAALPIAQIGVRDALGARLGWAEVGYWQGVLKVSDAYMQFVGVILINYALPRLSAARDLTLAMREYGVVLGVLLAAIGAGLLIVFALRDWVVQLLFAQSFAPMRDLFGLQMVGDFFRTIAAATSFFFLARGVVRVAFAYELMQGLLFALVFLALPVSVGRLAPVYAHVVTYVGLAMGMWAFAFLWLRRAS